MWPCRYRRVLGLVVMLAISVWARQSAAPGCHDRLQRAAGLLHQHEAAEALSLLGALPSRCQTEEAWNLRGVADGFSGHADQAMADFRQAVSMDATVVSPRLNLALALLQAGQESEGIRQLEKVVELDPAQPQANFNLGLYYANAGQCGKLIGVARRLGTALTATVQRSPALRVAMVHCLLQVGDRARVAALLPGPQEHAPAALHFTLASELASGGQERLALDQLRQIPASDRDAAVDFNRGMLESRLGEYRQARRDYFAAIDRNPSNANAYFRVGMDYAAAGNRSFAIPWLFKAHRMVPDDPSVATGLAEALIQSNYFDSAKKVLDGFSGPAASPLVALARGDLLLAQRQYAEATNQYSRALQLSPDLSAAVVGHARAEAELGQTAAARQEVEAALAAHPNDPGMEAELGHLELAAHDLPPALVHLQASWKMHPGDPRVGFDAAEALRLSGDAGQALSILQRLPDQAGNSKYHFALSQVYRALHRASEMQRELAAMRRLNQQQQEDLHFVPPSTYIP